MSKENLEQFMSKVADSEELQAKIGEEIDAEALIALGAECGCEFTAEELQDSAELSEEELGTVAGGREGTQPSNRYMQSRGLMKFKYGVSSHFSHQKEQWDAECGFYVSFGPFDCIHDGTPPGGWN